MIHWWSKTFESTGHRVGRSAVFRWATSLVIVAALLGVGGLIVATAGVIPINASSGHWAITTWFLQYSKERSVSTHTIGLHPPPLDQPWLVLKGAGHYEIGCRPCHGSPDLPRPKIAQHMLPVPPYLPLGVSKWQPEELFYIVKHGIKFTGMPAWSAPDRDDEVWAMVAFLQAFPQLDAEKYRQLVEGVATARQNMTSRATSESDTPSDIAARSCAPCHGTAGQGRDLAAFPKLAGQPADYIVASLQAYASGARHSGIMEPIAAGLSSSQIREVARHYAGLKSRAPTEKLRSESVERGKLIARQGIPKQDVAACVDCHGSTQAPMDLYYPLLAGQFADYLELQLTLFKQQRRGGSTHSQLMLPVVAGMNAQQIRDVAEFYASLHPVASPSKDIKTKK